MTNQHQLVMRAGPTPGTTYSLEGELSTIGRDSTNTIVINDGEVSRRHARLTSQGGKYVIEDLGSTNGTFVNGQRLTGPVVLKPGDMIAFGEQITLAFESLSFDPNATVMSKPPKATIAAQPAPEIAAPPPAYAGQVPAGPPDVEDAPKKSNKMIFIGIAVAVLVLICACVAFFLWVDADPTGARWCTVMPFLAGCP